MNSHTPQLATLNDIKSLVSLENRCFTSDRVSERSFRYFISKSLSEVWVIGSPAIAYGLILFHRGTGLARIYSLAVDPSERGKGLAKILMDTLERSARSHNALFVRLEVADDNFGAIALYQKLGYLPIRRLHHYYEDGHDGIRLEKRLDIVREVPEGLPYYQQTTDFTCGCAALMMALKLLDERTELSQLNELNIWREATTVFMTTGHGGTSPFGLALAAKARGFSARVWVSHNDTPFIDSVRSAEKKEVITLIHHDFIERTKAADIPIEAFPKNLNEIRSAVAEGNQVIMLISTYRLNRSKEPHWIWLVHIDERYAYFNDPDVDTKQWKSPMDAIYVPVPLADFEKMIKYGRNQYRAAIVLSPAPKSRKRLKKPVTE